MKERKKYIDHIPLELQGFEDVNALGVAIDIEFDKLYAAINGLLDNRYTNTMDLETVKRWESILLINAPIDSSLQARRNNILSVFMSQPPINLSTLQGILEAFLNVPVNITQEGYTVKVFYRGVSKLPDLKPLFKTIYNIIPANIEVSIKYAFVTWEELNSKNWNILVNDTWQEVLMGE